MAAPGRKFDRGIRTCPDVSIRRRPGIILEFGSPAANHPHFVVIHGCGMKAPCREFCRGVGECPDLPVGRKPCIIQAGSTTRSTDDPYPVIEDNGCRVRPFRKFSGSIHKGPRHPIGRGPSIVTDSCTICPPDDPHPVIEDDRCVIRPCLESCILVSQKPVSTSDSRGRTCCHTKKDETEKKKPRGLHDARAMPDDRYRDF